MIDEEDTLLLVVAGPIVSPPEMGELLDAHCAEGADITVMFNPKQEEKNSLGEPADIYVCNSSILKYIPQGAISILKRA